MSTRQVGTPEELDITTIRRTTATPSQLLLRFWFMPQDGVWGRVERLVTRQELAALRADPSALAQYLPCRGPVDLVGVWGSSAPCLGGLSAHGGACKHGQD
mgnify:CR=1 FL=1